MSRTLTAAQTANVLGYSYHHFMRTIRHSDLFTHTVRETTLPIGNGRWSGFPEDQVHEYLRRQRGLKS